jgi:hypothetical protein
VHILNWQDESLTIPPLGKKVISAKMFVDKSAVKFIASDSGLTFSIPRSKLDEVDTIIELEIK